jgi:hypothetical protein
MHTAARAVAKVVVDKGKMQEARRVLDILVAVDSE